MIKENSFDILDYLDYLETCKQDRSKRTCPVCNGNNLSINQRTGKWNCFTDPTPEHRKEIVKALKTLAGQWEDKPAAVTPSGSRPVLPIKATKTTGDTEATGKDYVLVCYPGDFEWTIEVMTNYLPGVPFIEYVEDDLTFAIHLTMATVRNGRDKFVYIGNDSEMIKRVSRRSRDHENLEFIHLSPSGVGLNDTIEDSQLIKAIAEKVLTEKMDFINRLETAIHKASTLRNIGKDDGYIEEKAWDGVSIPIKKPYKELTELLSETVDCSIDWLIPDYLAAGQFTVLAGKGGTGKSLLCYELAKSIATGTEWLGIKPTKTGKVFIMSMDENKATTVSRLREMNFDEIEKDRIFLRTSDDYWSFDEDNLKDLDYILDDLKPDLVVIDCLRAIKGKIDENSGEVQRIIDSLRKLGQKYNSAIVVLHHINKVGQFSGHTSIRDMADELWLLTTAAGKNTLEPQKGRIGTRNQITYALGEDDGIGFVNPEVLSPSGTKVTHPNEKVTLANNVISVFSSGEELTVNDVLDRLGNDVKRNTLKKTLSQLVSQGKLIALTIEDDHRQKIYRLSESLPKSLPVVGVPLETPVTIIEKPPETLTEQQKKSLPKSLPDTTINGNSVIENPSSITEPILPSGESDPRLIDNNSYEDLLELSFQKSFKDWANHPGFPEYRIHDLPYPVGTTVIHPRLKRVCKVVVGNDEEAIVAYYETHPDAFERFWDYPASWSELVPEETF